MRKYFIFGGANIDIQAMLSSKARLAESNPSSIKTTFGGVGRNIARAIANYNSCYFISAFSKSTLFIPLLDDLNQHSVNTTLSKVFKNKDTSMYIDIVDEDGVVIGASDMSLIESLKKEDVKEAVLKTEDNDIIVVEANLPYDVLEYILKNAKGYKIMDAVSSKKMGKVKELLILTDLIKLNNLEYNMLKDTKINDYIITYGNALEIKIGGEKYHITHNKVHSLNPTGCGDTFIGTFAANINNGLKLAIIESIKAAAASALILESVPSKEDINKITVDDLSIVFEEIK